MSMRRQILVMVACGVILVGTHAGPVGAAPLSTGFAAGTIAAMTRTSPARQRFDPPIPLAVVTPFRPPATRYGTGHRGVDLAAAPGVLVHAAGDGVVVFAGLLANRGVVSVEHASGLRTTYEPVTALVSAGVTVRRGEVIGRLERGHASCPAGACLHLGARMPDHVYLDPLALFRVWTVRLKPWDGMASGA